MQVMTFDEINTVSGAVKTINVGSISLSSCYTAGFDSAANTAISRMIATGKFNAATSADFGSFNGCNNIFASPIALRLTSFM